MTWDLERKLSDSNGTNGHHMSCVFAREQAQTERLAALLRHDRMVFAKTPMVGPAEVLDQSSHHTHRMAVVNERLVCIEGHEVSSRMRANEHGGKRVVHIAGNEFIGRLLPHVLPSASNASGQEVPADTPPGPQPAVSTRPEPKLPSGARPTWGVHQQVDLPESAVETYTAHSGAHTPAHLLGLAQQG